MTFVGNVQLVAGNASSIAAIRTLLAEEGIETEANADVYIREYASFGVDEAREIAAKASAKALLSARRVFVIVAPGMTGEAQNALLKTLEEPSGDALFFIVVPAPQMLLATLRSRAQLLPLRTVQQAAAVDVPAFLKARPEKRIDMLKPLLEKNDEDQKDLAGIVGFLSALERELAKTGNPNAESIGAVYRARKYVGDKGSLTKALLEQVALLI